MSEEIVIEDNSETLAFRIIRKTSLILGVTLVVWAIFAIIDVYFAGLDNILRGDAHFLYRMRVIVPGVILIIWRSLIARKVIDFAYFLSSAWGGVWRTVATSFFILALLTVVLWMFSIISTQEPRFVPIYYPAYYLRYALPVSLALYLLIHLTLLFKRYREIAFSVVALNWLVLPVYEFFYLYGLRFYDLSEVRVNQILKYIHSYPPTANFLLNNFIVNSLALIISFTVFASPLVLFILSQRASDKSIYKRYTRVLLSVLILIIVFRFYNDFLDPALSPYGMWWA